MKVEVHRIDYGPPWHLHCSGCQKSIGGGVEKPYFIVKEVNGSVDHRLCLSCGEKFKIMLELSE